MVGLKYMLVRLMFVKLKIEWILDNVYLIIYEKFGWCYKVVMYFWKIEYNLFFKI